VKRLKFHPTARLELQEAFDFYESKNTGQGSHLLDEVDAVTDRIVRYPLAAPAAGRGARIIPVKDFEYQIVYKLKGDLITIVAVMHKRRRPGYWKGRI
jgi:plasmid stabilization system protein ParE